MNITEIKSSSKAVLPESPWFKPTKPDGNWMNGIGTCPKHGDVEIYFDADSLLPIECPKCRQEEIESEAKAEKERMELQKKERYLRTSGIPKSFWNLKIASFFDRDKGETGAKRAAGDVLSGKLRNMILLGKTGTGKTSLLYGLVLDCCRDGIFASLIDFADLDYLFQESKSFTADMNRTELMDNYMKPKLLVIDEIEHRRYTGEICNFFDDLVIRRHARNLQTVLSGNERPDVFKSYMGERVLSRMSQNGKMYFFSGTDRRKEKEHFNDE